jgi:hypothetical protein
MKAYWGSGGIAPRPGRFIPSERAPGAHWTGGWVGPRAGLGAVLKDSQPLPGLESSIIEPIAQRYTTEISRRLHLWAVKCLKSKLGGSRFTTV